MCNLNVSGVSGLTPNEVSRRVLDKYIQRSKNLLLIFV